MNNMDENDVYEEYGSNYFELSFYRNGDPIILKGILKELPSLGQSVSWSLGPRNSISEFLCKYANSDVLQFITMALGNETNLMSLDTNTSRVFSNTTTNSISLSFRVYRYQDIGSNHNLTTADSWIHNLIVAAQPDVNIDANLNNIANNIKKTFDESSEQFKAYSSAMNTVSTEVKNIFKANTSFSTQNLADSLDNLLDTTVNNYGNYRDKNGNYIKDRVKSVSSKSLGASLFKLKLYPWLFARELIVFVDNWSYTHSKEVDAQGRSLYTDFSISCSLDQKQHSAPFWFDLIENKNTLVKRTKEGWKGSDVVYESAEKENENNEINFGIDIHFYVLYGLDRLKDLSNLIEHNANDINIITGEGKSFQIQIKDKIKASSRKEFKDEIDINNFLNEASVLNNFRNNFNGTKTNDFNNLFDSFASSFQITSNETIGTNFINWILSKYSKKYSINVDQNNLTKTKQFNAYHLTKINISEYNLNFKNDGFKDAFKDKKDYTENVELRYLNPDTLDEIIRQVCDVINNTQGLETIRNDVGKRTDWLNNYSDYIH